MPARARSHHRVPPPEARVAGARLEPDVPGRARRWCRPRRGRTRPSRAGSSSSTSGARSAAISAGDRSSWKRMPCEGAPARAVAGQAQPAGRVDLPAGVAAHEHEERVVDPAAAHLLGPDDSRERSVVGGVGVGAQAVTLDAGAPAPRDHQAPAAARLAPDLPEVVLPARFLIHDGEMAVAAGGGAWRRRGCALACPRPRRCPSPRRSGSRTRGRCRPGSRSGAASPPPCRPRRRAARRAPPSRSPGARSRRSADRAGACAGRS